MSDSINPRDTIVEAIKALPLADQWAVMESALKALKAASKPVKAKKEKDPNAPKKEATWWVKRTCEVREAIKDEITAENTARKSRGEHALPAVVAVRVASMLRDAGKLTQDSFPPVEDIRATWAEFLASPPETKPKPEKKAKAESTEPKAPKEPKAKKVLTDEEKAAKKEKEKAAREAKKAANAAEKAAEKAVTVPVAVAAPEPDEAEAETEVAPYEWTFNFGKGDTVYERLDYEGKAYIYDNNTKAYLGLFMEKLKKLNKAVPDPLA
jgi:colicin import membrane protein